MEDVLFDKNKEMRQRQKDRIAKLNTDNLRVEHVAIYDDIIKKDKFEEKLNDVKFGKLGNEFKILEINLKRYKKELEINTGLIYKLFENNNAEAAKKLFEYSFDAYKYLKDEKEVEKVLKNILTAIKENTGYRSEFSYLLNKDHFNNLKKYSDQLKTILEIMKDEQQIYFSVFNLIAVTKYGDDYNTKLENISEELKKLLYLLDRNWRDLYKEKSIAIIPDIKDIFDKFNEIKNEYKDMNLKRLYGQSKGNVLRLLYGNDYLAEKAAQKVRDNNGKQNIIIIETVKNKEEIRYFKKCFGDIHFVALYSPIEERNNRILRDALLEECENFSFLPKEKSDITLLSTKLLEDDIRRDKKEKLLFEDKVYGQQTEDCFAEADIIMESSTKDASFGPTTCGSDLVYFFNKLLKYFFITQIPGYSDPTVDEIMMSHAHDISLRSGCLKRTVGALIIDKHDNIISSGWNDPPGNIEKCCNRKVKKVKEERCKKQEKIKEIRIICCRAIKTKDKKVECDHITNGKCKTDCETDCETCFFSLKEAGSQCPVIKLNFSSYCRAIHAEERVMLWFNENSHDSSGYTFYTTTQPCYACIKRMMEMKFAKIVYKENYDDPLAKGIRYECRDRMDLKVFEGVTANSLFKYYYRPIEEA